MTVYVDKAQNKYGRMIMCHMLADDLEELHAMADKIGVQRKWFQPKSTPHYDICKSKRDLAIKFGAVYVERGEVLELVKKYREQAKEGE
jgi:hypothetical protein